MGPGVLGLTTRDQYYTDVLHPLRYPSRVSATYHVLLCVSNIVFFNRGGWYLALSKRTVTSNGDRGSALEPDTFGLTARRCVGYPMQAG